MDSNPTQLLPVIDANPSFMKVVRNFSAGDHICCTIFTAIFAGGGCFVCSGSDPDHPRFGWGGALVGGLLGLLLQFSEKYAGTRDRLKGIPPRPPPPSQSHRDLLIRIPRTGEQFVIVAEESGCCCGGNSCPRQKCLGTVVNLE